MSCWPVNSYTVSILVLNLPLIAHNPLSVNLKCSVPPSFLLSRICILLGRTFWFLSPSCLPLRLKQIYKCYHLDGIKILLLKIYLFKLTWGSLPYETQDGHSFFLLSYVNHILLTFNFSWLSGTLPSNYTLEKILSRLSE